MEGRGRGGHAGAASVCRISTWRPASRVAARRPSQIASTVPVRTPAGTASQPPPATRTSAVSATVRLDGPGWRPGDGAADPGQPRAGLRTRRRLHGCGGRRLAQYLGRLVIAVTLPLIPLTGMSYRLQYYLIRAPARAAGRETGRGS